MNNAVFGKSMNNVRKYRDIKFVTTEKMTNYLISEPNYHTTKLFTDNFVAIEMKNTQIYMNKLVYLELPILELSKIVMYQFWYDYAKLKQVEKEQLCLMDTSTFIVNIKAGYIYKEIAEDVEKRFDISNQELGRPLPKGKNKKGIGLMKDKLRGKIMKELVKKTYSYLIDDGSEDEKAKGTNKNVIKRKLRFENYKNCLEANQLENEIKHLEKIKLTKIVFKKTVKNS